MRIVVTGVPGVGKSTCMKAASEAKNLTIINFGDLMFDAAKEIGIKDRDEMRKMPRERQREFQSKAALQLSRMNNIIIDTHSMIRTPQGYLPGLPKWVVQNIQPTQIFVIEATPKEILARRAKDDSRLRDRDTIEDIEKHQEINRMAAVTYSAMAGASLKIIMNSDGKVDEAVKAVLDSL